MSTGVYTKTKKHRENLSKALKSTGLMKLDMTNGARRFKKALKNTGPRNHKKNLCLEKDTDRSFVENEIRLATGSFSVSTSVFGENSTHIGTPGDDKKQKVKLNFHIGSG